MTLHQSASDQRRHGLARALSKLGVCSRTQATEWIRAGRVTLNGQVRIDPETPTIVGVDRIAVDGVDVGAQASVYIMLNKPRGYVTTARDEKGRTTVYDLLEDAGLPWLGPVGRLDQASEGLLLMSNDTAWANGITEPGASGSSGIGFDKRYHVQIDRPPDAALLEALIAGMDDDGEIMGVKSVSELRRGQRNAWLEIVLDEGRNRQIRRLLAAFDVSVLRLVRVAIGDLQLGDLPRGKWRKLEPHEVDALRSSPPP